MKRVGEMSSGSWKKQDAASYDEDVARHYDHWIAQLSDPMAQHLCRVSQLRPNQHVLDVGCGSGVGTRAAARCVGQQGSVVGIDLSEGMLEAARQNEGNSANITYLAMDAERLDFAPETFDNVVSLCAVSHFPEIGNALKQMARVLKPGGHLVVSYGYARPINPMKLASYLIQRIAQRLNGFRPTLQAPGSLESVVTRHMVTSVEDIAPNWALNKPYRHLLNQMRHIGLHGLERSWCGHEFRFTTPEEFLEAQLAISTNVRKQLRVLSTTQVESIKAEYLSLASDVLARGGQLVYPYGAQFITGTKR